MTLVPHSFYFGPVLAATLHVARPRRRTVRRDAARSASPLLAVPIRCAGGVVSVPTGPGLGADPDPDVLRRYAYAREAARPFYLT